MSGSLTLEIFPGLLPKLISQHPGPQFNTILRVVIGTENIIQDGWFKLVDVIKGLMRIFWHLQVYHKQKNLPE